MIRFIGCDRYIRRIQKQIDVDVDGLNEGEQEDEAADDDIEWAGNEQQPVATSRYVGAEMTADT